MLWLKYTKSGRSCTRLHSIDFPVAQLSRIGWVSVALDQICEWHVMQVSVGGRPAKCDVSTLVWQYRQSMPSSFTWCLWLNGMGCSGATRTKVIQDPRS